MNHVLVTGSEGFIGRYVTRELLRRGLPVRGIDVVHSHCPAYDFVRGDITSYDDMHRAVRGASAVVHLAAIKGLTACEAKPAEAMRINYEATRTLHRAAHEVGAKFVFVSSDQVFDGVAGNYAENAPCHAINEYGRTKYFAEAAVRADPRAAICRTAMVFGHPPAGQKEYVEGATKNERLVVQGFVVQHVVNRLRAGQLIYLPDNEFVNPTYGGTLADQLAAVLERDLCGTLHCCGGERISRHGLGTRIASRNALDTRKIVAIRGDDPLRPVDVSLCFEHSEKALGMPCPSLDVMLDAMEAEDG